MARFSITKKGYSIDEVDGFINKLLQLTEDKLTESSNRINELKNEVRTLTLEKNEYKAKENSISNALTEALKKAEEIENVAKARYAMEINRLALFRRRFSEYLSSISDQTPVDVAISEFENGVKELESELKQVMQQEFNLEKITVATSPQEEKADGFDLQEALTPKESLEEICKELGLI